MTDATSTTAMPGTEKQAVGAIALIAVLRMLGLFTLLPVLSVYAATLEGATPILIGLAVGAYGLTQAGLQIPLGALSDRIGRTPVILGGLAVFALGSVLAGMSDTIHGVIFGRLLQGAGAISATLTALIADKVSERFRTRSMAVIGIGIGSSFIAAMVLGPWFAANFGVPALFGFSVFTAVTAGTVLLLVPDTGVEPPPARRLDFRSAFRPDLLRLDFYVFLLHAILTASFVALPFHFTSGLDLPLTGHWKLYVGAILLSLAGTVPLIIRDEHQGKGRTIGIAVVLVLIGQLLLSLVSFNYGIVLVALAIFFAGFNFLEAGLPARLSVLADETSRGASLGVFSSSQFLGAFVGGLIGGRFLADGNPGNVFFVCALLAAIWLALQAFGRFRHE